MPTILRFDGLRVTIYPNDHSPAHVHVIGSDSEVIFDLNCPEGPPRLRESYGFRTRDLNRIARTLHLSRKGLCHEWDRIHGDHAH